MSLIAGEQPTAGTFVDQHYPDFGFLPQPREYVGRVFTLSQKYPIAAPPQARLPKFIGTDYRDKWREYLIAAREYCFKDNIKGGNVEDDFDVAAADRPLWFHVPWQHYGPNGREGVHGLTKEASVKKQQLSESQMFEGGQTYAVGVYNEFGGFTIGQVWADKNHPNPQKTTFPVGTVVMKLLFTDVPTDQVPHLVNPVLWSAYVTDDYKSATRRFKNMALVQMDLMVRDDKAPFSWLFGTYQYNGMLNNARKWDNLVPVGIQWGNDPEVKGNDFSNQIPKATKRNPMLKETIINPDDKELPPTHLGWNGRLNGPVDNYRSSCMSCHMTAQAPTRSPSSPLFLPKDQIPEEGSAKWMRWFQNLKCGERFDKEQPTTSTDFSLQLAISLQNYFDWRDAGSKIRAERYKHRRGVPEPEDLDFPVLRDFPEN